MGTYLNKHTLLKNLCIAHPVVAHTVLKADGTPRNSFFRINDLQEFEASIVNNKADFPSVAYIAITGRLSDSENALIDVRNVLRNEWWFMDYVSMGQNNDGESIVERIEDAYDATFDIMQDFVRAMKDDWEDNGGCGLFQNFDLNKISFRQIDNEVENMFGWALSFEDETNADRITGGTAVIPGGITIAVPAAEPEIISFTNEDIKTVYWTSTRKSRFGNMPVVQVWMLDNTDNKYYLSAVQPSFDDAPPAFTQMDFDFNGNSTGFILIK